MIIFSEFLRRLVFADAARTMTNHFYYPMRDNIRIPHSAILTLTDGYLHPRRLGQEALFTVKQAAQMLDMTKEEVIELVDSKKLSAIILK